MPRRSPVRRSAPIRLISYGDRTSAGRIAVHGSLAIALDTGPPAVRVRAPLTVVRGDRPGPRSDPRADARLIARMVVEILAGIRPYHHLIGRTTPRVFERLESLAARIPGRSVPRLGTVRICVPAPGVAEVTAIAAFGPRVRALALRLEYDRGRWRCAAVETTVPPT